jgi:hypothetical protein
MQFWTEKVIYLRNPGSSSFWERRFNIPCMACLSASVKSSFFKRTSAARTYSRTNWRGADIRYPSHRAATEVLENDVMLFVPDDKEPLEFSKGVPKHFPFFHRETGNRVGSPQCCQETLEGMEVVLNFIAERERGKAHETAAFLTRCRRVTL